MTEHRRFLTVAEMAACLGICTKTVHRRIADGSIRKAALGGRLIRIPASELDRVDGFEPVNVGQEISEVLERDIIPL